MQNVATLVVLRNADCLMECGNEFEITLGYHLKVGQKACPDCINKHFGSGIVKKALRLSPEPCIVTLINQI